MKKLTGILLIALALAFAAGAASAQEHGSSQPATSEEIRRPATAQSDAQQHPENPNAAMDQKLEEGSKEAAGEEEGHGKFLHSPMVAKIGRVLGLPVGVARWVFFSLNFLILAGLIYWFAKSSVPAAFRNRSANIQKGIEEARKASEEAKARLSAVESRLAKIDAEVAELRASAEADFKQEEGRIRQAAEEDARRVIETAEQEIGAAAKNARRELKAYAADLAVDLASKNIQVSDSADQALISRFVSQLGKDGK